MPKVITLEKAADGSYVAPKNAKVEEYEEPKISMLDEMAQYERTVVMPEYRKRHKTHKFIVDNGQKASEFLYGVNKTVKLLMLVKKLIK